jgi:hypothetical protein
MCQHPNSPTPSHLLPTMPTTTQTLAMTEEQKAKAWADFVAGRSDYAGVAPKAKRAPAKRAPKRAPAKRAPVRLDPTTDPEAFPWVLACDCGDFEDPRKRRSKLPASLCPCCRRSDGWSIKPHPSRR